jgi:hypothetical protein
VGKRCLPTIRFSRFHRSQQHREGRKNDSEPSGSQAKPTFFTNKMLCNVPLPAPYAGYLKTYV